MAMTLDLSEESFGNPLDLMEQIASGHGWAFDRSTDEDLSLEVIGHWCDYRMFFAWHYDVGALLFACAFDLKVPERKRIDVTLLQSLINETMLVGHFDLWSKEGQPVFRHANLLRGGPGASVEQLEDLLDIALTECERYYPAFQFVIWAGKTPEEAIEAAILETAGEA